MKPTFSDIRKKVEAGERLTLDDGLCLYSPEVHLNELGELANLVRERKNGNFAYYNINTHLNPTNVCVYRCIVLCVSLGPARAEGLRDERRADSGSRAGGGRCRLHRDAHRRRAASSEEVRLVPEPHPHLARGVPAAALEGLDGGGDQLVRASDEEDRARDSGGADGGGAWEHARRRGGDFSSGGSRQDLRAQGRRAASGSRSIARRIELGLRIELHDALWAHRERLSPHRPPAAAARAAGRDGRVSDVHSAGVSSGEHGLGAHQEAVGA